MNTDSEDADELAPADQEASDAEYSEIFELSHGDTKEQGVGSLLIKLREDPQQSFFVSERSRFGDIQWAFEAQSRGSRVAVLFNSEIEGFNDLKRQLVYHLIPQFHPFGKVRSYRSTATYGHTCHYISLYLLEPNGLDGSAASIQILSTRLINDALDRARDCGSYRHYTFLYFMITFWIHLSMQRLISKELRLDVPLHKIDTKERQKSIQATIAASQVGWKRFSEDDISNLIDYALFWTEEALPELQNIRTYLINSGITAQKHNAVKRSCPQVELEQILSKKVGGIEICGYSLLIFTRRYVHYEYTWKDQYRKALDNVMQGILVLFSLTTGMRSSELAELKFDDINRGENGSYSIDITRYKTSVDPNYFGDRDTIPLPSLVGELIDSYRELRDMPGRMRKGFIFETALARGTAKRMIRSIQRSMTRIGEAAGVDGVHTHRFRKTVAEMLLSRSEMNIDLIRMLFGHRSYRMTLRYIARNPYLISAVSEAMQSHYAEDFINIVTSIKGGGYSGPAADRIASRTNAKPVLFKGKLLRTTIYRYIAFLLESGDPIFIKRTGLGTYCVSNDEFTESSLPPCLIGKSLAEGSLVPDVSNCKLECKNAVILSDAADSLVRNVTFYRDLLEGVPGSLSAAAKKALIHRIHVNEVHLSNLAQTSEASGTHIEVENVKS